MKKQVFMLLMAAVVSTTMGAVTTLSDTQTLIGNGGFLVAWNNHDDSVSWTHQMDLGVLDEITEATLTIKGIDIIDSALIDVYFKGTQIGTINFSDDFEETLTIPTSLIEDPLQAMAVLEFQKSWCLDFIDITTLLCATLDVTGTTFNQPAPSVVPAPGALILAGIGTYIVGVLRRRKSM